MKRTVRIRISRYQIDKGLGLEYRASSVTCTFTEYKRQRKLADSVEEINKTEPEISIMTLGSEKTFKKAAKKKLSPKSIDKFQ